MFSNLIFWEEVTSSFEDKRDKKRRRTRLVQENETFGSGLCGGTDDFSHPTQEKVIKPQQKREKSW